jgi:hypothetical protein
MEQFTLPDHLEIIRKEVEGFMKNLKYTGVGIPKDYQMTEGELAAFKGGLGVGMLLVHENPEKFKPQDIPAIENTLLAKDAMIRELRKGYIDMALIIEQLTTKDPTEEDIKDMKERANRLKESIK